MVAKYQINVQSQTTSGLTLVTGWRINVKEILIKDSEVSLHFVLSVAGFNAEELGLNVNPNIYPFGMKNYTYTPGNDNASSIDTLLANTIEADLDAEFGNGNWTKV